jgi:tetratricopeptide (TPR) repeat protein
MTKTMVVVGATTALLIGLTLVLVKTTIARKARPVAAQRADPEPAANATPQTNPAGLPASIRELIAQGSAYGRNADWRKAYECFQQVIAAGGTNGWSEWEWSWATGAALAAGETNVCEAWCASMLDRFGREENPDAAERCAKVCLALPGVSGALLERAAERADFSVALNPDNRYRQMAKAMAEYRRGHWSNALEWLRRPEHSSQFDVAIHACGFAAMARHQLGDPASARKGLDELNRRLKMMVHTGELGETSWDGCARAVALRAEAERLILGREVSPPLNPVTIADQRKKWQGVVQLVQSAERLARQESWAQARDAYAQALADPEFDWDPWQLRPGFVVQQMAAAFLLAGDEARHRDLCRTLLDRPHEHLSLTMQERNAWACLIKMDHFPPDLKARALAAIRQTCQGAETENSSWAWLICGLAAYREGRYDDALSALDRAQFGGDMPATARLLLCRAMACQQAGRTDDATAALQEAEAAFARTTPQSSGWWNSGFYQIALKELRARMATPGGQPKRQ